MKRSSFLKSLVGIVVAPKIIASIIESKPESLAESEEVAIPETRRRSETPFFDFLMSDHNGFISGDGKIKYISR